MSKADAVYPPLPDKQSFTISEAAALSQSQPHILRYWEKKIPPLAAVKRRRGRRYYAVEDIVLLRRINDMIAREGYTINGVRAALAGGGAAKVKKKRMSLRDELERIAALL